MKALFTLLLSAALVIFYPSCTQRGVSDSLPQVVVESEEVVYEFQNPDNGSHPFWCHGSSIIARNGDDVFMSGIETLPQYQPMNNIRWVLYKRDVQGWSIQQSDEINRQREPCPIGLLDDGRLVMSVNPTIQPDIFNKSTLNKPEILEFSANDPGLPYKTVIPEWNGSPRFTEHSYRTFSVDRENNEYILFQNVGSSYSEWAFRDKAGKWFSGQLTWMPYVDDPIVPFNDQAIRVNYPSVVLKDKAVHFCGNAPFNKWSRIQNMDDAKRVGLDDIISAGGGRIAGGRFRRLYYTWTPDISSKDFDPWIVIANSEENGENLRMLDMWVDKEGAAHLIYLKNPINKEIRDKHFPDIKRIWSINYVVIKEGKIITDKVLIETGEGVQKKPDENLPEECQLNWGRYHFTPDGRAFIVFHVSGKGTNGEPVSENRLMELGDDGTVNVSSVIPLQNPMSFFFTATPRGGSLPSLTIDILGQGTERNKVLYARIGIK